MSVPVAEGEILAGKYRVERILGRGGMGVVMAAMHLQLNQLVAIKLLLPGATADVTERFLREARAAVRLKTEHVARVIDVGELADGAPYMVMEYLDGQDLSQVVRSGGALPVPDAVEYVLHACEAIAEAHAQGIIHRDLKPANLFLTRAADGSRTVKVLDFGISKAAEGGEEGEGMALTKTTAVLGSPLYMSPEQMKSARQADVRSDVWSLGAILYELLTGMVPFNATTFTDLVLMVNMHVPPPIAAMRPDVPPALEAAVLKCLEKPPQNRFQNVADLAWAIAPFGPPHAQASAERASRTLAAAGVVSTGSQSMRPPAAGEATAAGSITALSTSTGSTTGAAQPGKGKAIAVIAFAVAVGVAVTVLAFGRSGAGNGAAARALPSADPNSTTAPPVTAAPTATASAAAPAPTVTPAPEPSVTATATAAAAATQAPKPVRAAPAPAPAPAPVKKNPLEIQLK